MEGRFIYGGEAAVVPTAQGKLRGYEYNGITIFKGVPYAQAERFHAPEPVTPWKGILDATSYGYVCPLLEIGRPNGELMVPHRYWPMNEHCQNLNIWTPACDGEKRPVLVWLHGGGFEAGSAIEQVAYEGENMCRHGQVVVVSVNHRLNILGYMDLSAFGEEYANSGNAGGDDIIAALKWIHENIAGFGGDPENVTVFGQSGGGAKVTTLLQSPAADGLYSKGINMSGIIGPVLADSKGSGEELVKAIMKELDLRTVKELEQVPYDAFAASYRKLKPEFQKAGKYVGCSPFPNEFYVGDPCEKGFREETSRIPLLIGSVYGEFASFGAPAFDKGKLSREEGEEIVKKTVGEEGASVLLPLFEKAYPGRNPAELLSLDFIFRLPTIEYLKKRTALNSCTWAYLFNQDMPLESGRSPWHCSDIPFVFRNTELVPSAQIPGVTDRLEKQIFDSVMAFAKTGDPNNEAIPQWQASTPDTEHTMIFDGETRAVSNFDRELIPLLAKYMGPVLEKMRETMMSEVQH